MANNTISLLADAAAMHYSKITTGAGVDVVTLDAQAFWSTLSLGAGNDTIISTGTMQQDTIALGEGDNRLDVRGADVNLAANTITAGAGNDTLYLDAQQHWGNDINLGNGKNEITLITSACPTEVEVGALRYHTHIAVGKDDDKILITGTDDGLSEASIVDTGGNNLIKITSTEMEDSDGLYDSSIKTGNGNDTIIITATSTGNNWDMEGVNRSTITTTGGNNEITVTANAAAMRSASVINTGTGHDNITLISTASDENWIAGDPLGRGWGMTESSRINDTGGNNTIHVEGHCAVLSSSITTGGGSDTVSLIGNGNWASFDDDASAIWAMRDRATVNTGAGNDSVTLRGWIGNGSNLIAGTGNDTITWLFDAGLIGGSTVQGGAGTDIMQFKDANEGYVSLQDAFEEGKVTGVEIFQLDADSGMRLEVCGSVLRNISPDAMTGGPLKGQRILRITGDGEDSVTFADSEGWESKNEYLIEGIVYTLYQNSSNQKVLVQTSIGIRDHAPLVGNVVHNGENINLGSGDSEYVLAGIEVGGILNGGEGEDTLVFALDGLANNFSILSDDFKGWTGITGFDQITIDLDTDDDRISTYHDTLTLYGDDLERLSSLVNVKDWGSKFIKIDGIAGEDVVNIHGAAFQSNEWGETRYSYTDGEGENVDILVRLSNSHDSRHLGADDNKVLTVGDDFYVLENEENGAIVAAGARLNGGLGDDSLTLYLPDDYADNFNTLFHLDGVNSFENLRIDMDDDIALSLTITEDMLENLAQVFSQYGSPVTGKVEILYDESDTVNGADALVSSGVLQSSGTENQYTFTSTDDTDLTFTLLLNSMG